MEVVPSPYFLLLMALHGSLLITSTAAGSKLFALPFGLSASATVLSYMCTFVILDTIAELYGRRYSRLVINLGLLGMAVSVAYFKLAIALPPAEFWRHQSAIESILGSSWRIWLGGWIAYILSQHLDLWSFLALKDRSFIAGNSIAFRAWVSILIGQLIDTVIFMVIAFYGEFSLGPAIVGQYLVKLIFVTLAAPLVPFGVWIGKRMEARLLSRRSGN